MQIVYVSFLCGCVIVDLIFGCSNELPCEEAYRRKHCRGCHSNRNLEIHRWALRWCRGCLVWPWVRSRQFHPDSAVPYGRIFWGPRRVATDSSNSGSYAESSDVLFIHHPHNNDAGIGAVGTDAAKQHKHHTICSCTALHLSFICLTFRHVLPVIAPLRLSVWRCEEVTRS